MENKKLNYNKKNISSIITSTGPTYFKIADSALTLFNKTAPKLAEMSFYILRANGELQIKLLTETLSNFNITTSAFFEFLSKNENLDFPLTQYENIKKNSIYQLINNIQESNDMSLLQKQEELKKLWKILDESDEKKRENDFKCMLRTHGIKVSAGIVILLATALSAKIIIKAVKTNHTKVAVEAFKTARTTLRLNAIKSIFK